MTTQMTARDKILLVGLVLFLVCAGLFWFGIRPLVNENSTLKSELALSQVKENELRYKASRISFYRDSLTEKIAALEDASGDYYPMMASHDVDALLTGMALAAGLSQNQLRDLSIEEPDGEAVLRSYLAASGTKDETLSGVYAAKATFVLRGSRQELQAFLDQTVGQTAVRVTGFSWTGGTDGVWMLSLKLAVYMTDNAEASAGAEALLGRTA